MAITVFRECRSPVSDQAPNCPQCGIPVRAGLSVVVRRASQLNYGGVASSVWVDSVHIGDMTQGREVGTTVAPGRHRIDCERKGLGFTHEVDVPPGAHLIVAVKAGALGGGKVDRVVLS